MNPETVERLIAINREFYRQFSEPFDATRRRIQPGVMRILERIGRGKRILDVGCGNGALFLELVRCGFAGNYTGLDFSPELVDSARARANESGEGDRAKFLARDLSVPGWEAGLDSPFDAVTAFAVLHHLPLPTCAGVLTALAGLMPAGGALYLSHWQFLKSPRWRERIQPWEKVGLDPGEVDPDDYLLDWRRGGTGFRYVHHFGSQDLRRLAHQTGFEVAEEYSSDGETGDLGRYHVWIRGDVQTPGPENDHG